MTTPGSMISALKDLPVTTINPADLPDGPTRIAQYLAGVGGDLVVFGPGLSLDVVMATARDMEQSFPEVDVVLVHQPTPSLLGDAMAAGIRQVIAPETATPVIAETVAHLAAAAALRRARLAGPAAAGGPGGPEAAAAPSRQGQLITVMSAKGGVGRTTVAVNLALELSRGAPNEVVLVDLDLVAGEVDQLLGLEHRSTVATVATPGVPLDLTVLKLSLCPHPTGLLVLPAPDNLVDADAVDPDRLVEILTMLKGAFRTVVVDTAPGAGAPLAVAAEVADELLAIATPDLGGLRSLRRNLDGLDQLGFTQAHRRLVLNRADLRTGLSTQAIESTVELPVSHAIPECREIPVAANQSLPLVEAYPKADAVRVLRELAAALRPAASPAAPAAGVSAAPAALPRRHLGAA
ncbi:MAG: P-loop NTPase [Acidimicrobiia bacterium]|nr:P-loop NTPase [Acidimicrobiia bacterium]